MKRSLILLLVAIFLLDVAFLMLCHDYSHEDIKEPKPIKEAEGGTSLLKPIKEIIPNFVKVNEYRKSESGTVYGDVISHSKGKPFGDGNGRSTNAHETTHGINSEIRNSQSPKSNGFYVLEGRGVVVKEPKLTMADAKKFVPQNLRSLRWKLYMEEQIRQWNDTPTYICDEWVAYVNGGACGVDDVKQGKHKEKWTDGVFGCIEFSIYTIGLCMAVKEKDPEYWNNDHFRKFVIWEMRFAQKVFMEGRVMKEFKWDKQDKLVLDFLTSAESEGMRKFVKSDLEGVLLDINISELQKYFGEKDSIDKEEMSRSNIKLLWSLRKR